MSHDHSGGPVGYIQGVVCDGEVRAQLEALADFGDVLGDLPTDSEA
jgi:hypothetical protein